MRIRAGDPVAGVMIRSLALSARTRVETFRAVFDGEPTEEWHLPGPDETAVGEFRFNGTAGEPLLMWDGTVPAATDAEAYAFFDANVERYEPPVERVVDATTVPALPDDEFWPIIDSLGGRTWDRTIGKAERLAAEHGEQFAIRWAQTAGLKALPLADLVDAAGWGAGHQLHVIGATLAQGKDVYAAVLHDPATFEPRWLSDLSAQTIWIATGALNRLGPREGWVHVETAFTSRHRAILERAEADTKQWQRDNNIPQDDDREPFLRVARAVVKLAGGYRERVILLVDAENAVSEPSQAVPVVESFGGTLVAGPEYSTPGGFARLFNGVVFTIKRRSTLPAADYLAKYASTPIGGNCG